MSCAISGPEGLRSALAHLLNLLLPSLHRDGVSLQWRLLLIDIPAVPASQPPQPC